LRVLKPVRGRLCLHVKPYFYVIEEVEGEAIVIRPIKTTSGLVLGREVNVKEIEELIVHGAKS